LWDPLATLGACPASRDGVLSADLSPETLPLDKSASGEGCAPAAASGEGSSGDEVFTMDFATATSMFVSRPARLNGSKPFLLTTSQPFWAANLRAVGGVTVASVAAAWCDASGRPAVADSSLACSDAGGGGFVASAVGALDRLPPEFIVLPRPAVAPPGTLFSAASSTLSRRRRRAFWIRGDIVFRPAVASVLVGLSDARGGAASVPLPMPRVCRGQGATTCGPQEPEWNG
jgi:hypothetical protein